jgi:hypothetical protein
LVAGCSSLFIYVRRLSLESQDEFSHRQSRIEMAGEEQLESDLDGGMSASFRMPPQIGSHGVKGLLS